MLTVPRNVHRRAIMLMIDKNDCKEWIVAKEEGKNGYKHWQIRLGTSNDQFFDWVKTHIPTAHVEKAESKDFLYERKEGDWVASTDRPETLQQRFGKLRESQKRIIKALQGTNDRQIVVWYDQTGCVGKSWLTGALWERGQAYVVPPTVDTVKAMVQYVASCYFDGGWRPYIIIDIPRSWKWSEQLYTAIESIKDGLIYDTRYRARMTNVRGVKILVMSNTLPKIDALSIDRWVIINDVDLRMRRIRQARMHRVQRMQAALSLRVRGCALENTGGLHEPPREPPRAGATAGQSA